MAWLKQTHLHQRNPNGSHVNLHNGRGLKMAGRVCLQQAGSADLH